MKKSLPLLFASLLLAILGLGQSVGFVPSGLPAAPFAVETKIQEFYS